jgi:hypothetical protein
MSDEAAEGIGMLEDGTRVNRATPYGRERRWQTALNSSQAAGCIERCGLDLTIALTMKVYIKKEDDDKCRREGKWCGRKECSGARGLS